MERGQLPAGWVEVKLGDLAFFVMGQAPPGTASNFSGDGEIFVKAGEFGVRHPVVREWTTMPLKYATSNDVLVCVVGATAGKLNLGIDCAIGRSVAAIQPSEAIGQLLLYFQLLLSVEKLRGSSTGSAQGVISKKMLSEIDILLPPLNEQQRIAVKLDSTLSAVDACRERLDGVAAILKRFRQAVLAAATSGELTREWREERGIDMDWTSCRLAEIAEIQGGITKDSKKQLEEYPEIPYLRVANVQRGYLDLSEVARIKVPPSRLNVLLLKAGDILFNEGGDRDKVGRGWIWEGQIRECVFQNHVFRARLHNSEHEPKFVSWWSNTCGTNHFLGLGKQTTNLASISKATLGSLPINLPPPAEQREIVRRVEDLFNYADQLEAKLTAARRIVDRLTPALLAKAFHGEMVPQDPNDEPASDLLAQLKANKSNAAAESPSRRLKTTSNRRTMSIANKDSIKAVILSLKTSSFSFDELRVQAGADYESLRAVLFELLEEPSPVVRQVFDQETKAMKLEKVRP